MQKQTKSTFKSSEITNHQTVVKEIVETTTTADGTVITSTRKVTTMNGNELEPTFKEISLLESDQDYDKKLKKMKDTQKSKELKTSEEKKKTSKSLAECFGFKSKTKHKDAEKNLDKTTAINIGEFENDALKSHNAYRRKHGVPNLTLSKDLCTYAKEWADHLASTNSFQHRNEKKYGENIYTKWSSDPNHVVTGKEAVDSWYSEIKDHIFGKEPRSLKSGHFTQVIWKESERVGVAMSRQKDGRVYVVANYDPPGNFIGKFAENVPSLKN